MADKTEAMEHVIHSSMPIDFERRYAMDNLIAQDADLIDMDTKMVVEVTEADRDAAAQYDVVEAFARHRKYGYDQGYYDGCTRSVMQSIIPAPKPDPLVEIIAGWTGGTVLLASDLRAALEARGLEIREKGG